MKHKINLFLGAILLIQIESVLSADQQESIDNRLTKLTSMLNIPYPIPYPVQETPKPKANTGDLQSLTDHEKDMIRMLSDISYRLSQQSGSTAEVIYESGRTNITQKHEIDNHLILNRRIEEESSKSSQNQNYSNSSSSTGGLPLFLPINYINNSSSGGSSNSSEKSKRSDNKTDDERNQEFLFHNLDHGGFKLHIITRNTLPNANSQDREKKITFDKGLYTIGNMSPEEQYLIGIANSIKLQ